jgi:hypothetical protein
MITVSCFYVCVLVKLTLVVCVYSTIVSRSQFRWWSSWALFAAYVPIFCLYFVWLPLTCMGYIRTCDPLAPPLRGSELVKSPYFGASGVSFSDASTHNPTATNSKSKNNNDIDGIGDSKHILNGSSGKDSNMAGTTVDV